MYQDRRPRFSPVKEGEELDVKIEAVGEKGDGIAKKNGFVLFVPGVNEGDEVRIKVTRVLKKVGFAEKVGDAQGPIEESEPKQQDPVTPPPSEPEPEDSEDFGEESDYSEDSEDVEENLDEDLPEEDSEDVEEDSDDEEDEDKQ